MNGGLKPQPSLSAQEVLAGLVERVTYHNAENGFCVLRIKARGHRDLVTVVGHAATISAGEWVTAGGEWVNDALDTSFGTRHASGWYLQGAQALAPRWFVAGRVERIDTTLPLPAAPEQDFRSGEATLGFRFTPEITLRGSYRTRQLFGRDTWDHLGAVSLVWYRRWM